MQKTYRILANAIAVCVLLQAAWIALGVFTLGKYTDDGHTIDKNYDGNLGLNLHGIFGMALIPLLALVLFGISFAAKLPEGVKWAGFVLLAVVVQIVLAFLAFAVPAIGILHGVNAFVVLGVSVMAGRKAAQPATSRRASPVAM
jgi:hypothetical protein